MPEPFVLVIYGQAPSVNSLYRIGSNGNLYLTAKGKTYKKAVFELFQKQMVKLPKDLRGIALKATFKFYFRQLWMPDGKPVRRDYDGPIKIVQDALAEALKFDDSWIFLGSAEKRKGSKEKSVIILEPYIWRPDEDDE